ncbi:MAG: hypothetical protein ACOZAR_04880 [Patescibacteria group bacterium]
MPNKNNKSSEFLHDNRLPSVTLLKTYQTLQKDFDFEEKIIFKERFKNSNGKDITLPSLCFTSKIPGPALWLIAGIHGEEPAGPNAIANKIRQIGSLSAKIPIVVMPLCNPKGYYLGWRYPNQAKFSKDTIGQSVGDSEYLLPNNQNQPDYPREKQPSCWQSEALTKHILKISNYFPPILSLDLHEDNMLDQGYIYSQGEKSDHDPVAREIVKILTLSHYPLHLSGKTRFDQIIDNGVIGKNPDGSIDELLAATTIFINKQTTSGPSAKSVIVVETSAQNQLLSQRQLAHELLLDHLEELWKIANT